MDKTINAAIAELRQALDLFQQNKANPNIVGLLTDAAGLIAQAIQESEGHNPIGTRD